MKIAICILQYHPLTESQYELLELAAELHKRGHEIHLYCAEFSGAKPGWLQVHYIPISAKKIHNRLKEFDHALKSKFLQNFDCRIGFNKLQKIDFYFAINNCFLVKKKKYIFWKRLLPHYRTMKKLENVLFSKKSKTHIFYFTQAQMNDYQKIYDLPKTRFTVLPPSLPSNAKQATHNQYHSQKIRQDLNLNDKDFLILTTTSNTNPHAGKWAITAISNLHDSLKQQCHLIIVRGKHMKSLKHFANKHKLQSQIHVTEEQENLIPYFQCADLLLHPAATETLGLELLQAIVAGLPVITSSNCHYSYVVLRAQAGKIIPEPFEQQRLNQALLKFLNHLVLDEYHKNALQYAEKLKPGASIRHACDLIPKSNNPGKI